jgi:hypothetical protein
MTPTSIQAAIPLPATASDRAAIGVNPELDTEKRPLVDTAFVEMFRQSRIAGRISGSEFPTLLESFHHNPAEALELLSGHGSNPV